jgi:Nucleocytoplasmic shuttling protein for mRNA cap-binding EIF4E
MSPANVKPSSSSPLAFTPTSVLRKMTADKDFETGNLNNLCHRLMKNLTTLLGFAVVDPKQQSRQHNMPLEPHSNWKPIEPIVPKPHQPHQGSAKIKISA